MGWGARTARSPVSTVPETHHQVGKRRTTDKARQAQRTTTHGGLKPKAATMTTEPTKPTPPPPSPEQVQALRRIATAEALARQGQRAQP